uniref:Uncharacterized protein n=1 Tax=viral metagenome TaxID=1070528 RepID=A0A6C0C5I1_9ZZZZ
MKNVVRINIDNKMNDLELNIENRNIINLLNKKSNTKGKSNIRQLYSWTNNSKIIKCYGWYEGEHDCINKHELIPNGSSKFLDDDSSTILLYGDIYLICFENSRICDFTVSDYAEFYEIINEGFDDCDSEYDSADSEEDYDEVLDNDLDEDYVEDEDELNDELLSDYEIVSSEDSEELDTDNNIYS